MKRNIFLLSLALCAYVAGYSQYAVGTIPQELKEGANVVKRLQEVTFQVNDIDRSTEKTREIFTILNSEGKRKLFFYLYTNKSVKIDEVDIKVYNELGFQINKFKKKDLSKEASQGGLVEDGFYHWLNIPTNSFPVTVEINYEIIQSNSLFYPRYDIQESEESVEHSTFTAIVPKSLDLRYREQKVKLKPEIIIEGDNKVYKWEVKNLKAFKKEPNSMVARASGPAIILAPNKFRCFNTYGDMSTWKSFGEWAYGLQAKLEELPQERQLFFADLVKNAKTEREKVALVYDYLQKNFRYVSIQIGIGGYKPFPAKFTDDKKYGDCKGLSFYVNAALKAIGIKSYTALINSEYNDEPVTEAFPFNNFNHMILCVPQQKDTIWLECTSSTVDFGFLGSGTENRNALLLTEKGGVLAATPRSMARNNAIATISTVDLSDDGSGSVATALSSFGEYKGLVTTMLSSKKDDQKEMIVKYLGFRQPDEFLVVKKNQGIDISQKVEKIPQFSAGSKMFLNSRLNPIWRTVLPKSDNRQMDYYFEEPFIKTDTTIYNLPAEYVAESVPPSTQLKCEYASYSSSFEYVKEKNQLISIAKLELNEHRIPAGKYADVKKFFDSVLSADGQKLIIKKN